MKSKGLVEKRYEFSCALLNCRLRSPKRRRQLIPAKRRKQTQRKRKTGEEPQNEEVDEDKEKEEKTHNTHKSKKCPTSGSR